MVSIGPEVVASVVVFVLAALAGVYRSYNSGLLASSFQKHRSATEAHDRIPDVVDKLETIHAEQERTGDRLERIDTHVGQVDAKVDELARTVAVVHAEDEAVDNDELRTRLGVEELDDDLRGRP